MTKNKHTIQKVFIEIDTGSMNVANSIQNNISMFIEKELLNLLEENFDALFSHHEEVIQIDKLSLSLHNVEINGSVFPSSEVKTQLLKQLEIIVDQVKNEKAVDWNDSETKHTKITQKEKKTNTLLYFLSHGKMPWWATKNDSVFDYEHLIECTNNTNFKHQFKTSIADASVRKRIINQFSNLQIALLTSSENYLKSVDNNKIMICLNKESFEVKVLFWETVFKYIKTQNDHVLIELFCTVLKNWSLTFSEFVLQINAFLPIQFTHLQVKELKRDYAHFDIKTSQKFEKKPIEESIHSEKKSVDKSFYVDNSGLIILHPFIKQLFKNCNLLNENNDINNKELAAHILHYAATKEENDFEHRMLFEKFLCGIPMQQSIKREVQIEESHKACVEELLQSVVTHWSALKNSSSDILRSEFLQREGKLDLSEDNPKLFIERKTQDILLDKIPWNISIVKIPWIDKLMYTQW